MRIQKIENFFKMGVTLSQKTLLKPTLFDGNQCKSIEKKPLMEILPHLGITKNTLPQKMAETMLNQFL